MINNTELSLLLPNDDDMITQSDKIKIQEIHLIKQDKKDIFITSLLKYIYNNETKNSNNKDSFNGFLKIIANTGIIRHDIVNPKYDIVRNIVLNNIIKTITRNKKQSS